LRLPPLVHPDGWTPFDLLPAVAAVAVVGAVSFTLAFLALRARVRNS
jgi:hypothetical protein